MTSEPNGAQPGEPTSIIGDLQDLLKAAWTVQEVAETRAKEAREELFRVAKALCASTLDQQRQAAEWETKALADLIIFEVGRQRDELVWLRSAQQTGNTQAAQQIEELQQQLKALQHDLQISQTDLAQARAEKEQLRMANVGYEGEIKRLGSQSRERDRRLAELTTTQPAVMPSAAPVDASEATFEAPSTAVARAEWPRWLQEWSETEMFGRDADLLRVIGSSLECRREELLSLFARQSRERERGLGAEKKVLVRLIEMTLVEAKAVKLYRGNPPDLLALLPRGVEAYRLIYGSEPRQVYEDYRAAHKSEDQIYLVLQTIDFFEGAGYLIERFPTKSHLADGAIFAPDLIATRGRERLSLEVETGSYANGAERDRKWRIIAAGTGGQVYIVTHNRASMTKLKSEVQNIRYAQPVCIHLTNLEDAAALPPERSIWLEERPAS